MITLWDEAPARIDRFRHARLYNVFHGGSWPSYRGQVYAYHEDQACNIVAERLRIGRAGMYAIRDGAELTLEVLLTARRTP